MRSTTKATKSLVGVRRVLFFDGFGNDGFGGRSSSVHADENFTSTVVFFASCFWAARTASFRSCSVIVSGSHPANRINVARANKHPVFNLCLNSVIRFSVLFVILFVPMPRIGHCELQGCSVAIFIRLSTETPASYNLESHCG